MSGLRAYPWATHHFGPIPRRSLPQVPLHFHPCLSFRQEQLWVRVVTLGCPSPSSSFDALSSCWSWALYVPTTYCWAFYLRSVLLSPESLSLPRSLMHPGGSSQPPISQIFLFPFFLLALRASVLFPLPIPDQVCHPTSNGVVFLFLHILANICCQLRFWS